MSTNGSLSEALSSRVAETIAERRKKNGDRERQLDYLIFGRMALPHPLVSSVRDSAARERAYLDALDTIADRCERLIGGNPSEHACGTVFLWDVASALGITEQEQR